MKRAIIIFLCIGVCLPALISVAQQSRPAESDDFLFLFLNPGVPENKFTSLPQIKLAEEAGIRKFTFLAGGMPLSPSFPSAWKDSDAMFSLFTDTDPLAQVAPRLALTGEVGDAGLTAQSAIVWKDGPSTALSWTDPKVQDAGARAIRAVVSRYENSKYGKQVWAYHISAKATGEWLTDYRTRGADYSKPSQTAFQQWLRGKYAGDASLQTAWGNPSVHVDTVPIPTEDEPRFPIHPAPPEKSIEAFYQLPREQNWVDYSEFVSDNTAACIEKLAAEAKRACGNRKPVITFYGYVFELPGSISGHLRVSKLLRDPNIDYIAAPISYSPYTQRLAGGPGAAMGAVDSMALHGKTWTNEDDLHTHAQPKGVHVPDWYWDPTAPGFAVPADATETTGILERNLAFAAFHHAATWWMDLYGGGWFSDPALWQIWQGPFGAAMRETRREALPYTPTVAVIIDEESRCFEKFTSQGFFEMYPVLRNSMRSCGASVGFYYLDDYLEGMVPKTRATVFVNVWHVNAKQRQELALRTRAVGGTVIWQYAPGYLNPEGSGTSGVQALTGITVKQDQGLLGSTGVGPLAGLHFGGNYRINPRIIVDDAAATPLANYDADRQVSAAAKDRDGVHHILLADDNWTSELVHQLLAFGGIPLNTDVPAIVEASKGKLFVYALQSGALKVKAPPDRSFEDGTTEQKLSLSRNENRVWNLKPLGSSSNHPAPPSISSK